VEARNPNFIPDYMNRKNKKRLSIKPIFQRSLYRGVYPILDKNNKFINWSAEYFGDYTKFQIGIFDNEEEAAKAYDAFVLKLNNNHETNFNSNGQLSKTAIILNNIVSKEREKIDSMEYKEGQENFQDVEIEDFKSLDSRDSDTDNITSSSSSDSEINRVDIENDIDSEDNANNENWDSDNEVNIKIHF
jgi:hypothetical protein